MKTEKQHERAWRAHIGRRHLTALERALSDPKLTSLRQEIARIDLRLAELEQRKAEGECRGAWRRTGSIALQLTKEHARPEPDNELITTLLTELTELTVAGANDYQTWAHIEAAIEQRRRLVDTERKYEELNQYLVPVTRLNLIFAELYATVAATLVDAELRRTFVNELRTRLDGTILGVDRRPVALLPAPGRQPVAVTLRDDDDEELLAAERGGAEPVDEPTENLDAEAVVVGA